MKNTKFTFVENEIELMKLINHNYIINLEEVIDDPKTNKLYIILEYMKYNRVLSE